MVSNEVTTETRVAEKQIVEAGAQALVTVRLSHRRDIHRSRTVLMRLMDEMELQVGPENAALLEALGDLLRREDENGQDRLNDLYKKIISLPGRAKTMKDMGETLRVLGGLERSDVCENCGRARPRPSARTFASQRLVHSRWAQTRYSHSTCAER